MLSDLISDIVKIDDVLIIVRTQGAILEMRSNSLSFHQKEKWITIGENDGPCHMHVDSSLITKAQFFEEKKPDRISFSIRFFDKDDNKQFSAVFSKMYDEHMNLKKARKKLFDDLFQKYGAKPILNFT